METRSKIKIEKERDSRVQLVITMLFTGGAFAVSYLTNFFLAPYITSSIGADAYGFITLARNFSSYALILTTALNSYAARFISIEYHRNNMDKANCFLSSVFYANIILVSFILCVTGIGIINLEKILNIPLNIILDVKILFFLIFLSFGVTSVGTAFAASAYIKNRLDLTGIYKGCSYVIEAGTIFGGFVVWGPKLWIVGLGIVFAAIEIYLTNYIITKKMTPELFIKRSNYSFSAVKTLVINGIWNSINSLGNTLNTGLDLIITNLLLTPLAMGQLSYAKTIGMMFSTLFQLIAQPFQPIFLKLYADKNIDGLIKEMKFSMKVSGFLSSIVFSGFIALGSVYFKLWIPGQDTDLILLLTNLTIVSFLGEGSICPLFYIYTLTTKFKIPCIVTIIGGLLNLSGMFFLIKYTGLGIYAVVLTTAVISSIINMIFNPLYMSKCLDVKWNTFLIPMIRYIFSCLILTILFCTFSKLFMPSSWLGLILSALGYCIIGLMVHVFIVFNKNDRMKIIQKIKGKRH